jgi:surface antigen
MRHPTDAGTRRSHHTISTLLLGSVLAVTLTAFAFPADAARKSEPHHAATTPTKTTVVAGKSAVHHTAFKSAADNTPTRNLHRAVMTRHVADNAPTAKLHGSSKLTKNGKARLYASRRGNALQCVPFARAASGIELKGNAVNWWDAADGVYQRGSQPEVGSVLNFRANNSMRLGHVAVVKQVVNGREIEIDHANWAWSGKGNVSRNVAVIDVSDRNDWSAVRVSLGHGEQFGSIYATYGFIYDRPDNGTRVAASRYAAAPAAHDLRGGDEIAEAPRHTAPIDDAPAHTLR